MIVDPIWNVIKAWSTNDTDRRVWAYRRKQLQRTDSATLPVSVDQKTWRQLTCLSTGQRAHYPPRRFSTAWLLQLSSTTVLHCLATAILNDCSPLSDYSYPQRLFSTVWLQLSSIINSFTICLQSLFIELRHLKLISWAMLAFSCR